MSTNPFYLKALPDVPDHLFCNRVKEIAELTRIAESKNDAVIYAPRRFGKTSLVRRVQRNLARDGAITIAVDFNGVMSVNDAASKLATAIFKVTHGHESLWKKALRILTSFRPVLRPSSDGMNIEITAEAASGRTGLELLEATMSELEAFVNDSDRLVSVFFDEFQELVVLPDSSTVEAIMRTHIQQYQASHFFVGSRRRLLQNMFSDEHRPFFRSALDFRLEGLPQDELAGFISDLFTRAGKSFPVEYAKGLAKLVSCHPHYSIKLSYHTFELSGDNVDVDHVYEAFIRLLEEERGFFESLVAPLPLQQRLLLRALAKEPTAKVMANNYVKKHDLGTSSGISHSLKQLTILDYIEEGGDGVWRVVDPVFSIWLAAGETVKLQAVTESF